ncbi:MAG: DUF1836 domain-containing protein [Clostridia bacterium]|nr:DUF1836 domain-containing protein [Clostridia bacterium]
MDNFLTGLNALMNEITSYGGVPPGDIPDIALYMDQVTTFMNRKLGSLKRNEEYSILTKTMINNYTKARLVFPPENKKYEKEHIMLLTIIYHLKQILSVSDMARLLAPVIDFVDSPESGGRQKKAGELYGIFTEMESEQLPVFEESMGELVESLLKKTELRNISGNDRAFLILLIISLVIQAEKRKNLAERIIDMYFKKEESEQKADAEAPREKGRQPKQRKKP